MMCSLHPKVDIIPPHEQGTESLNFRTMIIYAVKIDINPRLEKNAAKTYFGKTKSPAITISKKGIAQAIQIAYFEINGNVVNRNWNTSISSNLLVEAYINSMMYKVLAIFNII